MTVEQDLSPWAHPKAQAWFKALFQRSQFGFMLEDVIRQPVEQLDRDQIRAILSFAVLLGRKEIWPEDHQSVLKMVLDKARAVAKHLDEGQATQSITLRQHLQHSSTNCEFQEEIEILRRRIGSSFKTTELQTPENWGDFWT